MKYLTLNDIDCYKRSFKLSNQVWDIVIDWDYFAQKTIGSQFARCVDSISSNIAEGFGRYGKKDKIKFYRYSMGSVREAMDWCEKAKTRNLLNNEQYSHILKELKKLPKEINQLIKYTDMTLKK